MQIAHDLIIIDSLVGLVHALVGLQLADRGGLWTHRWRLVGSLPHGVVWLFYCEAKNGALHWSHWVAAWMVVLYATALYRLVSSRVPDRWLDERVRRVASKYNCTVSI